MKYEVSFRAKTYLHTWNSPPDTWRSWSAYHSYGKPGNSGENSSGTVHPSGNFWKKGNTFFPFLLKRPQFFVPFILITSTRLPVQRKRKLYRYFVNGTTQSRSCFRCPEKYQYRNFRANSKRSFSNVKRSPLLWLHNKSRISQPKNIHIKK